MSNRYRQLGGVVAIVTLSFVLLAFVGCDQPTGSQDSAAAVTAKLPTPVGSEPAGPPSTLVPDPQRFYPSPLTNAPIEKVIEAALDFTKKEVTNFDGNPQVVLARFVTADELNNMGIGSPTFVTIEIPPMAMVILKGDFAYRFPGALVSADTPPTRSKYIAYIFDLWAGLPTRIMTSPNGSHFRQALGDASLPTPELPMLIAPTIDPSTKYLHYGEVAPGIPLDRITPETTK